VREREATICRKRLDLAFIELSHILQDSIAKEKTFASDLSEQFIVCCLQNAIDEPFEANWMIMILWEAASNKK